MNPHSRGAFRPTYAYVSPSRNTEGAGKAVGRPGGRCTRGSRARMSCASAKTTGTGGDNRPSPRDGLRLIGALPGEPAFATVISAKLLELRPNLAPAWARQDHTTSPSALMPLVSQHQPVHRIPLHVRDDAYAPLVGAEREGLDHNFRKNERQIFFARGLDKPDQPGAP